MSEKEILDAVTQALELFDIKGWQKMNAERRAKDLQPMSLDEWKRKVRQQNRAEFP